MTLEVLRTVLQELQQSPDPALDAAFLAWLKPLLVRAQFPEQHLDQIDQLYEVEHMLAERIQAWTQKWKQEGFRQGIEQGERQAYVRQACLRFGAEVAERLATLLADVHQTEQLAQIGDWVIQCRSGSDLLARVESLRTQH